MKLGNFFSAAPHARPVNPKPITFTAVSRSVILPGGTKNPNYPGSYGARVTGCFVFVGGDADEDARDDARRTLEERRSDEAARTKKPPLPSDTENFNVELTYQVLWRVLHEWDPVARKVGDRLYDNVNLLRETVVLQEANRVLTAYYAYVKEEHPEDVSNETFRGAEGRSERVVVGDPSHG